MSPTRWRRLQGIVESALLMEPSAAKEFLRTECEDESLRAEAAEMLDCYGSDTDFIGKAVGSAATAAINIRNLGPGDRVGVWQLEKVLGHGGMGTVYLASRADDQFQSKAAIKVIRVDLESAPDLIMRFRVERQILANLSHPNIARLLDGGSTDTGAPYLVMEYVEGQPLDRYIESARPSLRQRLLLFRELCGAVQYAHQNLVVHRDLKPGNVYVNGQGSPVLLDFGIAKLLAPSAANDKPLLTRAAERLMTPEYASPEQLRGDTITTATDVYGLGVLLYELIAQKRPFDVAGLSPAAVERLVCETVPEPPSTAASHSAQLLAFGQVLPAELDNVVCKAMHKDPARRYASAGEFGQDIDNFLNGFPVRARPDTWTYRTTKFIRRHKVAASAALLFALTVTSLVIALAMQSREARQQARTAEQVATFLVSLFKTSRPDEAKGRVLTAREILDQGAKRISTELASEPLVQSRLLETLGTVYYTIGAYDRAESLLQQSVQILHRLGGDETAEAAEATGVLALVALQRGKLEDAVERQRKTIAVLLRVKGENSVEMASSLSNMGLMLSGLGDLNGAVESYRKAISIKARSGSFEDESTLTYKNNLEMALADLGRYKEAEPLAREVLQTRLRLLGNSHSHVGNSLNNLAFVLMQLGRYTEAESFERQALDLRRKIFGKENFEVGQTCGMLATILTRMGRYQEAQQLAEEAVEIRSRTQGPDSLGVAFAREALALSVLGSGDARRARQLLEQVRATREAKLKPGHSNLADVNDELGLVDMAEEKLENALAHFRQALSIRTQKFGPEHVSLASIENHVGEAELALGNLAESRQHFESALRLTRRSLPPAHPTEAEALLGLSMLEGKAGDERKALRLIEEALAIQRAVLSPSHPSLKRTLSAREALLGANAPAR